MIFVILMHIAAVTALLGITGIMENIRAGKYMFISGLCAFLLMWVLI